MQKGIKYNKSIYFQRLKEIAESKGGLLLSPKWETAKTKYQFKCKEGHPFELTSDKITTRGDWCPFCAGRYGDFEERFKSIIENLNGGVMLTPYVNALTHIYCTCVNNHIFPVTPINLSQGKWCPKCRMSHGERAIEYYLKTRKIPHKSQFTFDDLKGDTRYLPFDFAVFDNNNKLLHLIEYDGEQHFRPLRHSRNKEANLAKFHRIQENDRIKNKYCITNNISLIRISFFDVDERRIHNLYRDIERILDDRLK